MRHISLYGTEDMLGEIDPSKAETTGIALSIEKWESILTALTAIASTMRSRCGLCEEFGDHGAAGCEECPIRSVNPVEHPGPNSDYVEMVTKALSLIDSVTNFVAYLYSVSKKFSDKQQSNQL